MDKFGIFNLLNSFYDFYNKNKNKPQDAPVSAPAANSAPQTPAQNARAEQKPLQNSMLAVMQNHDRIVERVRKNANVKRS